MTVRCYTAGTPVDLPVTVTCHVQAQVTAGGTDRPNAGTTQTWTVATTDPWPAVQAGTELLCVDADQLGADPGTFELFAVTDTTAWTVTRGANGITTGHRAGFTLVPAQLVNGSPTQQQVPADPGTLTVTTTPTPADTNVAGTPTTLTYTNAVTPTAGQIARQTTGRYIARIDTTAITATTVIEYQWHTTGTAAATSDTQAFIVTP